MNNIVLFEPEIPGNTGNIMRTCVATNTKEDIYLIFGKESTGIPKEILREDLDRCMRIPMTDKVRALNLSNCAAIVIYEVLRQQNYEGLLFKEPHKSEDFIIE